MLQVRCCPGTLPTIADLSTLLRCDSSEHPLSRCPKPVSVGLPYAHCFICLEKGHLASKCPSNSRGIYPNGGSCKVCGSVQHRAQDCPDDKRGKAPVVTLTEAEEELLKMKDDAVVLGTGREAGADEDDFMIVKRKRTEVERKHAEAQALEKAAKKAQSAQQKRLLQKSQLMSAAAGDSEGPSPLSLLLPEDSTATTDQRELSPPRNVTVVRTTTAPVRKKPKVVVF